MTRVDVSLKNVNPASQWVASVRSGKVFRVQPDAARHAYYAMLRWPSTIT